MDAIIVKVKDKNELKLVNEVLQKMRISSKSLSEEEIEDFGLIKLMKEADRTQKVSHEEVMKKLKGK